MTDKNLQVSAALSIEELLKAKFAENSQKKDILTSNNDAKQTVIEPCKEEILEDNKIKIIKNYKTFDGIVVIQSVLYKDIRGSFQETYNETIQKHLPSTFKPIQDNLSKSMPNVFRGMHWDVGPCNKAKYVSCPHGKVLDIFVDMRKEQPTYGKIGAIVLDNVTSVFIPDGFAHGFLALDRSTSSNMLSYKVDNIFIAEHSKSFNYSSLFYRNNLSKTNCLKTIDAEVEMLLKINFDNLFISKKLITSEKDGNAPTFEDISK